MKLSKKLIVGALLAAALVCCHQSKGRTENNIKDRVVRILGDAGMCSGEQVRAPSSENYILTAAHCKILEKDGQMLIVKESGDRLWRRVIAEDPKSDLLLVEGLPGVDGLDIARSMYREHIRTFTHGANHDTYETEGYIIAIEPVQIPAFAIFSIEEASKCKAPKYKIEHLNDFFGSMDLCVIEVDETAMTAMIVPGSSGGAVVNDHGDIVGVVSAGNGNFGFLVTLKDIKAFLRAY